MFTLRGKNVAGLGPQMNQGMPPFWAVYVSVADADATTGQGHGRRGHRDHAGDGRVRRRPHGRAPGSGGSFISVWQPKEHIGAELVNEPGTFVWNELSTTDMAGTKAFYTSVFGWGLEGDSDARRRLHRRRQRRVWRARRRRGRVPRVVGVVRRRRLRRGGGQGHRARRLGPDATQRHGLRPGRTASPTRTAPSSAWRRSIPRSPQLPAEHRRRVRPSWSSTWCRRRRAPSPASAARRAGCRPRAAAASR